MDEVPKGEKITILIDTFEPVNLEILINQVVPTIRGPFNFKGFPDYTWIACDGHRIGISRKQAGEMLSSIDATEEQLRKDMISVDEMYLSVENPFGPTIHKDKPGTVEWILTKDGKYLRQGHKFATSYNRVYAWFNELDKAGITVIQPFDWECTANVIVALYKNSQREEHTTLQRYIKHKVTPKKLDPQVQTLMGIVGGGIGEVMAQALVERYKTAWIVLTRLPEELAMIEGIGMTRARKLLNAIGRYE